MADLREGALSFQCYKPGTLDLERGDLSARADDALYEKDLPHLQEKAYAAQIRSFLDRQRALIVFEGWDAAGKGGCIKRLTALMDPRGYKVWPIAAPNEEEREHHWLWRFWTRLPGTGELAVFDRSWYGRVLVERVEGFAKKGAWERAFDEINAFERTLTADGVRIVKFFLHIDAKTQLKRFKDRESDPIKNYKLGAEDWRNRGKRKQYQKAIQEMLDRTHRPDAPWIVVPANDKKYARLEVLRAVIDLLEGKPK